MPINASYEFTDAEHKFFLAKTTEEKILALEEMIRTAPHHKGSENLLANLKRRLAKLKKEYKDEKKKRKGKPALVKKSGDAFVSLVGLTNTGKSFLLSILTNASPKVSEFPFTTIFPEQGILNYEGCKIQIVEIPALHENIQEDSENLGIARMSDLIIIIGTNNNEIERTFDELKNSNINLPTLVVHNKADMIPKIPAKAEISISALTQENIKELKEKIFAKLKLIRIFTKEPGKKQAQLPVILKASSKIKDLAEKIHKTFLEKFNYALIWGKSVKFQGQRCGLDHELKDSDVVEIYLKK
jgi:hypothetical protein